MQIKGWKRIDTIADPGVDKKCVIQLDDGLDGNTEEDYVDWDAVYQEKPLVRDLQENEGKYSVEKEMEIFEDARDVINRNTYYKDVHYDYLLVECTVRNTSELEEHEYYANSIWLVYTTQDDKWAGSEAVYFGHSSSEPGESDMFRYVLAPGEELTFVIGYPIAEDILGEITEMRVGFPTWIENSEGVYTNPSGQYEKMIRIQ